MTNLNEFDLRFDDIEKTHKIQAVILKKCRGSLAVVKVKYNFVKERCCSIG